MPGDWSLRLLDLSDDHAEVQGLFEAQALPDLDEHWTEVGI